jgi:hypothetical protein
MTAGQLHAIDIIAELIRIQNAWQQDHGRTIDRDNREIWAILNALSNEEWIDMFEVITQLIHQTAARLTDAQQHALDEAYQCVWSGWRDDEPRVLDRRRSARRAGNQHLAWRATMVMREIYNDLTDHTATQAPTPFARIFL